MSVQAHSSSSSPPTEAGQAAREANGERTSDVGSSSQDNAPSPPVNHFSSNAGNSSHSHNFGSQSKRPRANAHEADNERSERNGSKHLQKRSLSEAIAIWNRGQRSSRPAQSNGNIESWLLYLPDVLLHRIYLSAPEMVSTHTAVCKRFREDLCKAHLVHLKLRSFSSEKGQADSLKRFDGEVSVYVKDSLGRFQVCRGLLELLKGGWPNLTGLNLESNRIQLDNLTQLTDLLHGCPNLKSLEIGDNKLGVDGIRSLVSPQDLYTNLTTLDVKENELRVQGSLLLSARLQTCTRLTHLDVSDNQLGLQGIRHLTRALEPGHLSRLATLNLSRNQLDFESIEVLARGLQHNSSLTSLSLGNNKEFGPVGARMLGPVLKANTLLTHLDLQVSQYSWRERRRDGWDRSCKMHRPEATRFRSQQLGGNRRDGSHAVAPQLHQPAASQPRVQRHSWRSDQEDPLDRSFTLRVRLLQDLRKCCSG
ncbi:hypothetical protein GUITHDRAFT_162073 [Guillardia theta CCMP2712]|uniref:F-box domain-containing protein n=1 Tax=Guillardia theta (strain CCMP2712) TaxID=905079 RepID=L1JN28_GUITC|nr:hypothetical protein GUITHDRAFT_162073 [Guillardia theta CCMP2712]EKX49684.1 hypothetical protein GUITHDRAFT_162073 [Guillardia theta CCMP2712]|eukprot:XP_005836664.1 hypothetical protein GUITHDRAFT_162073 [Guillardia theta CCMP2712]